MPYATKTIKNFLTDLCKISYVNPIVVISENDIKVQSDLYSIDAGYYNLGRAEDMREFFLGDTNDYDYEEATDQQIDKLIGEAYSNTDWVYDLYKEKVLEFEREESEERRMKALAKEFSESDEFYSEEEYCVRDISDTPEYYSNN